MRFLAIAFVVFGVAGCAASNPSCTSAPGPPVSKDLHFKERTIRIHSLNKEENDKLRGIVKKQFAPDIDNSSLKERVGFSAQDGEGHCDVYFSEIRSINDYKGLMILGHEVLHCFYGSWHNPGQYSLKDIYHWSSKMENLMAKEGIPVD